jgi:hypothetical protein
VGRLQTAGVNARTREKNRGNNFSEYLIPAKERNQTMDENNSQPKIAIIGPVIS